VLTNIILKKKERVLLEEHYRTCQTRLIRSRAHAIILNNKGYNAQEIADILLYDEKVVRGWIKQFETERISSIFPKYEGNTNASKLTKEQLDEIQKTLEKPPATDGLPSVFWSVKRLKEYISAQYGVVYESKRSYHHLLFLSRYSFRLTEGFDQRRDDILVKKRMSQIRRKIKDFKEKDYLIFAADECSLSWETECRRAWIKKGEKTRIKMNRQKIRQNYFGALNLFSHQHELIRLDWQNTETMIGALRELTKRYPDQKLCIIWDNARWHRSKDLRKLLGKGNEFGHIHFLWLPPYAPDKNPQEHVWRVGKEAVGNECTKTFEELKKIFENSIEGKKFIYEIG
jgi:transposase